MDERLIDIRIVKLNIDRGVVERKAHADYLDGLEDCAADALPTETPFIRTDGRTRAPVAATEE